MSQTYDRARIIVQVKDGCVLDVLFTNAPSFDGTVEIHDYDEKLDREDPIAIAGIKAGICGLDADGDVYCRDVYDSDDE